MAAAAGAGATPPLRLKDLLELDCDSCSAAGFRCYPRRLLGDSSLSAAAAHPMRHLLDSSSSVSLRERRRPSKLSHLSRSISRRLSRGGGFWRRRNDEDDDKEEEEPEAAGCDCEEETTSSSESSDNSSRRRSRASSGDSDFSSSASASASASASEQSVHDAAAAALAAAAGDEHEEQEAMKRGSSDDRDEQQLSPVAVMDFPADDDSGAEDRGSGAGAREDDDGAAWAPSFSLERLQRRSAHKIRRLGGHDDLGPVDLEACLAATSDPDAGSLAIAAADDATARQAIIKCRTEDEATPTCASGAGVRDAPDDDVHVLVPLLMGMVSAGVDADVTERLLLDFFFAEMKRRRRSDQPHTEAGRLVDGEAVATARGWLEGTGTPRWGLEDVLGAGKDVLAEMERGRRWMQVGEEEREVGAVVAGMLVDQVVDELIWDLLV